MEPTPLAGRRVSAGDAILAPRDAAHRKRFARGEDYGRVGYAESRRCKRVRNTSGPHGAIGDAETDHATRFRGDTQRT